MRNSKNKKHAMTDLQQNVAIRKKKKSAMLKTMLKQ